MFMVEMWNPTHLVLLNGALLPAHRTVPEAEEPLGGRGAGEGEGGALCGDGARHGGGAGQRHPRHRRPLQQEDEQEGRHGRHHRCFTKILITSTGVEFPPPSPSPPGAAVPRLLTLGGWTGPAPGGPGGPRALSRRTGAPVWRDQPARRYKTSKFCDATGCRNSSRISPRGVLTKGSAPSSFSWKMTRGEHVAA